MAADLADMKAKLTIVAGVTGGDLIDKFGTKLNTVGKTADNVNRHMASLTNGVKTLAAGFGAAKFAEFVADLARVTIQLDAFGKQLSIGFGQASTAELDKLRNVMRGLGIAQEDALGSAVRFTSALRLSGQTVGDANKSFEAASKLILSNKLSGEQAQRVYYALAQIASKGKLYAEELQQQLGETLAGFTQQVAQALGMSTLQLQQAMKNGTVSAQDFFQALQKIGDGIDPSKLQSSAQSLGKLKNAWYDLKASFLDSRTIKSTLDDTASAITLLTNHAQELKEVAEVGLAIGIGRWTSATVANTVASFSNTAALRQQLLAEVQLAEAKLADAVSSQRATAAQLTYAESIVGTVAAERALAAQVVATDSAVAVATTELAAANAAALEAGAGVGFLTRAAGGLYAMLGGGLGIAIAAITLGLGYLLTRETEAEEASRRLSKAISDGALARQNAIDLSNSYAKALGNERQKILDNIQAELALAKVRLLNARAEQSEALKNNNDHLRAFQNRTAAYADNPGRRARVIQNDLPGLTAATQSLIDANKNIAIQQGTVDELQHALLGKGSIVPVARVPNAVLANGSGGRSGPTSPTEVQIHKSYEDELKQLMQADIAARREMLTTNKDQLFDAQKYAKVEAADNYAKIANMKGLSDKQRQELIVAADRLFTDKNALANAKYLDANLKDAVDASDADLNGQLAMANLQKDIATTAADRRAIAFQILDLEETLLLNKQQEVRDSQLSTPAQKEAARLEQQRIMAQFGVKRQQASEQYAGPLAQYKKSILDNIGDMNTRFDEVKVDGLKGLEDGLVGLVDGTKTVAQAFGDMANKIIADLARIAIEKFILAPLMGLFGDGAAFSGGHKLFANGGAFSGGVQFFATGGVVTRPTAFGMAGGRMGVMGEAGPEAIMPLRRLSNGRLGIETSGGRGGSTNNVSVSVNVEGGNSRVQSSGDHAAQLGNAVAQAVRVELVKQQRPGGLLAKSR